MVRSGYIGPTTPPTFSPYGQTRHPLDMDMEETMFESPHKMFLRGLLALAACGALASAAASCKSDEGAKTGEGTKTEEGTKAEEPKKPERVVVSFHNMAEPFFVVMNRELLDEAKKLGVEVVVLDAQANSAKQTADVENALVQGASGIILAPTNVDALAPAVNEVIKAKVPVITVDRRVEGTTAPVPHVGADNVAGGRMLAEWVVKRHPDGASIVLLTGQPGSSSAIDRTKGIQEGLAAAGEKYRIVAEQTGNWARDQGLTVTENILTSLGANKPNAIISENDDMALGAIEALRAAGLLDGSISVLGFDAIPEALRLVQKGELAVTVEQSPSRQIRTALRQIVEHIRNGAEMKSVSIEPVLITKDNINDAERLSEVK
jgi:inositol transport system substrate-binding protein